MSPTPAPKTPSQSSATLAQRMMPNQLNNLDNIFGGEILSLVDQTAGVVAERHSGRPCVTVAMDRVEFREPIFAGELVITEGRVTYTGRTSMDILVDVYAENVADGTRRHTNRCILTFVAMGEDRQPTPVPPLRRETKEDDQLYEEALERRRIRLR